MKTNYIVALALTAGLVSSAKAGNPITYTDWTSASSPGSAATAGGTLSLSSGTVNVSYSGEFTFAQVNDTGGQYWVQPNSSSLPYTGNSVVGNAPTSPDIIALSEPNVETDTITFSKPVFDPIMLINSLGNSGAPVSYLFNQSFTLLSAGQGYWGGSSTTLTQSGDTLTGTEGAGAIEFLGEVSSISWQTGGQQYGNESWNGFTIGAETTQPVSNTVPDGGTTLSLLAISFGSLLKFRNKK